MTQRLAPLMLMVLAMAFTPAPATARPCTRTMQDIAQRLDPYWNDKNPGSHFNIGIRNLFDYTGTFDPTADEGTNGNNSYCNTCHRDNSNSSSSAWRSYVPCYVCHDATYPGNKYPDWLDLSSPQALKRNSYYMPGFNKLEASIARATDGTMPPFLQMHGWCDQITAKVKQWKDLGYPLSQ